MSKNQNAMIVMVVGGVVATALLGWAVSRSLNAPVPVSEPPAAITAGTAATPEDNTKVPRITVDELKQKFDRHEVTIIDVRDANAYLAAHIPGSLHIPFSRIEGEIAYLPKAKPIVLYCT